MMKFKYCKRLTAMTLVTLLVFSFVFSMSAVTYGAEIDAATLEKIDAYIETKLEEGSIPGLSLAIVSGDETVLAKGYGKTGNGNVKVNENTPFFIGTVTKSFTALAVQQLVGDGKLDLDTSVATYIPEFDILKPDGSEIKILELLNHTSGFSTEAGEQAYVYNAKYDIKKLSQKVMASENSNFPYESTYQYSNLNYIILGHVIESVTGMTYDDYIKNAIFEPLGMVQSGFDVKKSNSAGLAQGHRIVYGFLVATDIPYPKGLKSSGFMMSTSADMAQFLKISLNNGYYNASQNKEQKSLITGNALAPVDMTKESAAPYYDVIWQESEQDNSGNYNGFYGVIGSTPNFNTAMLLNQEKHLGISVMVNQANYYNQPSINAQTIANDITDLLLGKEPTPFESKEGASLWMIPVLALILSVMMINSIFKTRKKWMDTKEKAKLLDVGETLRGLLSLISYLGFPAFFDNTWAYFVSSNPEYVLPALMIIVVNLLVVIANFVVRMRGNQNKR